MPFIVQLSRPVQKQVIGGSIGASLVHPLLKIQ